MNCFQKKKNHAAKIILKSFQGKFYLISVSKERGFPLFRLFIWTNLLFILLKHGYTHQLPPRVQLFSHDSIILVTSINCLPEYSYSILMTLSSKANKCLMMLINHWFHFTNPHYFLMGRRLSFYSTHISFQHLFVAASFSQVLSECLPQHRAWLAHCPPASPTPLSPKVHCFTARCRPHKLTHRLSTVPHAVMSASRKPGYQKDQEFLRQYNL